MERVILVLWILFGILEVVMIIKFFQIATDVRDLKNRFSQKTQVNTKKEFYKWIVAGDTAKAKEALFNAIASTPEFDKAMQGVNDTYKQKLQDSLNKEFAKELAILGLDGVDLLMIR